MLSFDERNVLGSEELFSSNRGPRFSMFQFQFMELGRAMTDWTARPLKPISVYLGRYVQAKKKKRKLFINRKFEEFWKV
jgi:hypothetical protein